MLKNNKDVDLKFYVVSNYLENYFSNCSLDQLLKLRDNYLKEYDLILKYIDIKVKQRVDLREKMRK